MLDRTWITHLNEPVREQGFAIFQAHGLLEKEKLEDEKEAIFSRRCVI